MRTRCLADALAQGFDDRRSTISKCDDSVVGISPPQSGTEDAVVTRHHSHSSTKLMSDRTDCRSSGTKSREPLDFVRVLCWSLKRGYVAETIART